MDLDEEGNVRFPPTPLGTNVRETPVIAPGPRHVEPSRGERYLRALPFTWRGPYLAAVFVP